MSVLFGDVNDAAIRILRRNGCEVVLPTNQSSCGVLNVHISRNKSSKRDGEERY